MNIKKILSLTEDYFKKHNIESPRLDAEVLLADLLDMERVKLYVNFDYPLSEEELNEYRERIRKRAENLPVSYITGNTEFMSLDFIINEDVLVPRPETEILVEYIIDYCKEKELGEPNIVDVGTGSGVIMVSLGHYIEGAKVVGIDISSAALKVAENNIDKYELDERLKVLQGDLLTPFVKRGKNNIDIVVSNPPYICSDKFDSLPSDVRREPLIALDGGKGGLKFYRKLIPQVEKVLKPGGLLVLEIGCEQATDVKNMLGEDWAQVEIEQDYSEHNRMICAVING